MAVAELMSSPQPTSFRGTQARPESVVWSSVGNPPRTRSTSADASTLPEAGLSSSAAVTRSRATGGLLEELNASVERARPRPNALDRALAALKPLIVRPDVQEDEWVLASRLLRAAAIERRHSSPRHASIALLLSDALMFTEVQTVALADRVPVQRAVSLLTQRFISTGDERGLFRDLVSHRWYVTPTFDAAAMASAADA